MKQQKPELTGLRIKLLYGALRLFARFGVTQTADKVVAWPMAARKANKAARWMAEPSPPDVTMVHDSIAGRFGPIAIKKYLPPQLNPECPRLMFMHGGGWIAGGIDTLDYLCANVSRSAQCLIVSVDYRLAPETPFPGGLEDCYDALQWLASDPSLGPLPAAGVAVMGESAGGNLAAALCVLAARRGGPAIRHQTLIYPLVDATLSSPSVETNGEPGLMKKDIQRLLELYRGKAELTDPLLSPMFAENHAQLPPALIITADVDPARDDGARYARKLNEAGVPAKYVNYLGMPHGFFFIPRIAKCAAEGVAEISAEIVALSKTKHP